MKKACNTRLIAMVGAVFLLPGCSFLSSPSNENNPVWNDLSRQTVNTSLAQVLSADEAAGITAVTESPWGRDRNLEVGSIYYSANAERCRRVVDVQTSESLIFCTKDNLQWHAIKDLLAE